MIKNAIKVIRIFLPPQTNSVTHSQIEEAIDKIIHIPDFATLDRKMLLNEINALYKVHIDDFTVIERKPDPWIKNKESRIDWQFWSRYRDYLESEKNFSPSITSSIDRLTNRILDGLFDPQINGQLDKRGLVVGQVQSGKTANYTGLVCKAADAGFDFILVLAGIHNNLRSQTQLRLDESFLGFDTQFQRAFDTGSHKIGVGIGRNTIPVHSLTSSDESGDFSKKVTLSFATNEPIIGVVKKNQAVLKRVLKWLESQANTRPDGKKVIRDKKLLLIDDEADNASISTIDDPSGQRATKINGLIRDILRLFSKSGYVGYTATPFANIFIPLNEDNLFPRDFIVNLPAPSNYIGPNKVFGFDPLEEDETPSTTLPIVRRIEDAQNFLPQGRGKDLPMPSVLPESMKLAIRCFILTCAIRRLRGQKDVHNSMLIHVVRLINRQRHVRDLVEDIFNFYKRGIEMNVSTIINEFRETYEIDKSNYKSYTTTSRLIAQSKLGDIDSQVQIHLWDDVLPHLYPAVAKIEVKDINGGSADILNYYDRNKEGLSVIAIGGDKLSRGLTLEGLSVSYFLRASKMYDTLLQMGRWFGYRGGYMDLCRLFTSRELNEWYCHITKASEDLREQFDYMADIAGSTPEKYALGVQTHPGVLQISASNKIRSAVNIKVSWSGKLIETYEFQKRPEIIKSNLASMVDFIQSLNGTPVSKRNSFVWYNITPDLILNLLSRFQLSENLKSADPSNVTRFINNLVSKGELTNWSVALISKGSTDVRYNIEFKGKSLSIGCVLRNENEKNSDENIYFLNKSRIASPTDELIDLPKEVYNEAKKRTDERALAKGKKTATAYPNTQIVRNELRSPLNPLFLIYLLDPTGVKDKNGNSYPKDSDPIAGYAISFPKSKQVSDIEFAVHEQLLEYYNNQESEEEELEDDE